MKTEADVKRILVQDFNFDTLKIKKLDYFVENLLLYNKKRNLISKNTEKEVWDRHILDSAQIIKFIDPKNFNFHVKLYDKSPIKSSFLFNISKQLRLNCEILCGDVNSSKIDSNYIVCRAFRKLDYILNISRENCVKKHKIIILKGRNAQKEINNTSQMKNYEYRLENSISDSDSKIIILNAK